MSVECEYCYHCDRLAEEDFMTTVATANGFFMFCSSECEQLWQDEENKKNDVPDVESEHGD